MIFPCRIFPCAICLFITHRMLVLFIGQILVPEYGTPGGNILRYCHCYNLPLLQLAPVSPIHLGVLTYADILAPDFFLSMQWWDSNWKSDLVGMATGVNSTIAQKILLFQKALDVGNTKIYGFLRLLLYLFFYSWLSMWIFDVCKPRLHTALMTWEVLFSTGPSN